MVFVLFSLSVSAGQVCDLLIVLVHQSQKHSVAFETLTVYVSALLHDVVDHVCPPVRCHPCPSC